VVHIGYSNPYNTLTFFLNLQLRPFIVLHACASRIMSISAVNIDYNTISVLIKSAIVGYSTADVYFVAITGGRRLR